MFSEEEAVLIAKAIRAALFEIDLRVDDDQGAMSADCYMSGFAEAEAEAFAILTGKKPA